MPKQQRARKRAAEDDDNNSADDEPRNKKVKPEFSLNTEAQQDDNGDPYWQVSARRRLQVSDYKGITMVSIREYYEKDGKTLPGKGISLPIEQFNAMCELIPQVDSVLLAKGLTTTRPQYKSCDSESKSSLKSARKSGKQDLQEDDDDDEPEVKSAPSAKSKLSDFKLKANHEATSDEED